MLDPKVIEPVNLPSGYSFKLLDTRVICRSIMRAVFAVFGRSGTEESDPFLANAPSYVPELDLMVLSDQHEIAAFCTVWIDPVNHYAEFEPVGTVPSFQKRGLGSALLAEACNRLRKLGCPLVTVQSWSTAEGANKLYQGAGLLPKDNQLNWCWHKAWRAAGRLLSESAALAFVRHSRCILNGNSRFGRGVEADS